MLAAMEEAEIGEVSVDKAAEAAHEKAHEEHHRAPWLRALALSTAVFAVVAAVASLISGRHANEAILHQARATDQWAYYQAKGNKAITRAAEAEVLAALHAEPAKVAELRGEVEKYGREQEEIRHEAQELEQESRADLQRHEWFAVIVTVLQVSIGLSAIGALLESKRVWLGSLATGGVATAIFIARLLVH
jgi:hypothetical protein